MPDHNRPIKCPVHSKYSPLLCHGEFISTSTRMINATNAYIKLIGIPPSISLLNLNRTDPENKKLMITLKNMRPTSNAIKRTGPFHNGTLTSNACTMIRMKVAGISAPIMDAEILNRASSSSDQRSVIHCLNKTGLSARNTPRTAQNTINNHLTSI